MPDPLQLDLDPFVDANDEPWFRLGLDRTIPRLLRQLASEEQAERLAALDDLSDRVFPDGALNFASGPVVRFLARLAVHPATDDRPAIVDAIDGLVGVACEYPSADPFGAAVLAGIGSYVPAIFALQTDQDPDLSLAIAEFKDTWSRCRNR